MVRVVTALSGLVLIVLALRLAMAPLFPLDKFVAPAIAVFEAETGTVVKFGDADLGLLPTPRVIVANVEIELPDGLGDVHADKLLLSLNPLPFLSGSTEVGSVTVERPVARLSLEGGDFDPAKVVNTLANLAGRATNRHFLAMDGRLVLSSGSAEASLDGLTASAARTDAGDRLTAKATIHGTPISLTVEAGPGGVARAHVTTPALNFGLDGGLAGGAFAGRLDLSVPDAAALGGPFSVVSGPVTLGGAVTLSAGRVEMVDASASALGGSGRLSAALDLGAPRTSVDLHADFGRLPAGSLTALVTLASHLGFDPVGGRAPFDAGVDLKLAELALPGSSIRNVRLTTVDREGRFGALFDGVTGDGTLSGRLDLVPDGEVRRLGGAIAVKDVAVADVAAIAGLATPLTGRLAADLRLSARGRSIDELAATLVVNGASQLRDGHLDGVPLADGITSPALTGLSADMLVMGLDKPARLTGQGISSSGVVTLEATAVPRRLIEGGAAPLQARFEGPMLSADFDGDLDPVQLSANGDLTLTSRQSSALGIAGLPGNTSLDGRLEANAGRLTLSDARLMIGDGAFAGLIDLSRTDARAKLTGRLNGDTIDVAALAGAFAEAYLGAGLRPMVDADLHVEAERIIAGPIAAAGGPVDLRLGADGAEIALSRLSLGGGSGAVTLKVQTAGPPGFALKGKVEGARLASLAPLVGTFADGELDLAADINAQGEKRSDLFRSAAGSVDFSLAHGVLDRLDPVALLGRLARSVQTGFGSDAGRFGFDKLSGHVKLANGVATSDAVAFAAGDLQFSGTGTLGLVNGVLDLRLRPKMNGYPDFEVPIAVVGPVPAPRLYPDLPGLVDDPASGYERLAAMTGGFARLVGGMATPKLEAVSPDAMTSMIDTLSAPPDSAPSKPAEVLAAPTIAVVPPAVVPPLPLARPIGPKPALSPVKGAAASRSPSLASGPLDLGALGRESNDTAPAATRAAECRPGRDGRCMP